LSTVWPEAEATFVTATDVVLPDDTGSDIVQAVAGAAAAATTTATDAETQKQTTIAAHRKCRLHAF